MSYADLFSDSTGLPSELEPPPSPSRRQPDTDGPSGMYFPRHGPRYPGDPGVMAGQPRPPQPLHPTAPDSYWPDWLHPPQPLPGRYPLPNRPADDYQLGQPRWFLRPGDPGYFRAQPPPVPPGRVSPLASFTGQLESGGGMYAGAQPASMVNKLYGQYSGFAKQYGAGSAGVDNYAAQVLAANPNATLGDFYSGYVLGTGDPSSTPGVEALRTRYPAAYFNLVKQAAHSGYSMNMPLASLLGGQGYIPASYPSPMAGGGPTFMPDRPPSEWGRPPPMSYTPGQVPMMHEIGSVLTGLAPLVLTLLSGHSGFAGTAMLTAFGAYQGARNKAQLQTAHDAKTQWQTHLKETKARLEEEQMAAASVMATYQPGDPRMMQALREIAAQYGDQQLQAAIESGDPRAAERLFQARDKFYTDISKTQFSAQKQELEMQKMGLELEMERLKIAELQAKTPAEIEKIKAQAAAAAAKLKALQKQEEEYPGSTAAAPPPDTTEPTTPGTEPDTTEPTAPTAPGAEPDTTGPAAAPTPLHPGTPSPGRPGAPAPTPQAPGAPSGLPPRFGPSGPPPGYTGDGAAPQAAPAPRAAPAQRVETAPPDTTAAAEAPQEVYLGQITEAEPAAAKPDLKPSAAKAPAQAGPSEGDIEAAENGTWRTGRDLLHGVEPPTGMGAGINQAAETVATHLRSQLDRLANSGLQGNALIDAVRKIDNRTADELTGIASNLDPVPSASGMSYRQMDYSRRLMALARAAAPPDPKTGDPGWRPGQYEQIQKFGEANGRTQITLQRANTMARAASNVLADLKELQAQGVPPDAISRALDRMNKNQFEGNEVYTNLYTDLQAFTQEDQYLRAGVAGVTETERAVAPVTGIIPGSPEQIRGYIKHNIETAAARIRGNQSLWKQYHAPGQMIGYQPEAQAVIDSMGYLNTKTGQFDLPEGMTLPPELLAAVPAKQAPSQGWGPAQ